ncbi:MAG: hypothetical protein JST44_27165 [Cyanobacteria bacterium SZAS LIN-5]|nr:hypothetical protein [Cyanobacteria bacterium SZAS LIN-5]
MMSNSASWFLFIGLAAVVLAEGFNAPFAMATVPIALVCFSALQFFGQYVFFRDDSLSLLRETATTSKIPLLYGISLNKEDIEFYESAQQILTANGFKPGDFILSLYDFPAIVYVMNAKSPGQSWYISWPERDELNSVYFKKASLNSSDRLFVVLSGRNQNQVVEPHMQAALTDIRPRRKFVRIGTLPHPRKPDFKVYIYADQSSL